MDANFWWGILGGVAVTIVFGLPLNFLANIYTPSLTEAWNRRRSGRQERSKVKAVTAYKFVSELRSGQKDKYAYLLTEYMSSISLMLAALVLLFAGVFLLVLLQLHKSGATDFPINILSGTPEPLVLGMLATFVGLVAAMSSLYRSSRTQTLAWRLENFSEYKAQIENKWGPIT